MDVHLVEKTTRQDLLMALLHTQQTYGLSGLALTVAHGREPSQTLVVGTDEKGVPLTPESLFPVASLTKLATALAILRLADQGLLAIGDRLEQFVPMAAAAHAGVTIQQLLTHTAGLPGFSPGLWSYDLNLTWQIQRQACLTIAPTNPGEHVAYSNVGYGLLAMVVERLTDRPFHEALNALVIEPLGIEAYLGSEPPRVPIYLTDSADDQVGTPLAAWNSPFWRTLGEPWGGMVTTPACALALLRAYQGLPTDFLQPATIQLATQDCTGGLGGGFRWQSWPHCPWGLGPWLMAAGMNHFAFAHATPGTLCHTGYSGCAVYYDPTVDVAWGIHGTISAADERILQVYAMLSAAVLGAYPPPPTP